MTIPKKLRVALYILAIVLGAAAIVAKAVDANIGNVLDQLTAYVSALVGVTAVGHLTSTEPDYSEMPPLSTGDEDAETDDK